MKKLKLMWLKWRTRNWSAADHDMCLLMGPCIGPGSCSEYNEYNKLAAKAPEARLVSRNWTPRKTRVHGPKTCASHSWCHTCDDLRLPCSAECESFGPCTECDADYARRAGSAMTTCWGRCGDEKCRLPWVGPPRGDWRDGLEDGPYSS